MLDMNNATYGRSIEGTNNLQRIVNNGVKALRTNLTCKAYDTLKNNVDTYWNGADKDSFMKHFDELIYKIGRSLTQIESITSNALREDYEKFIEAQKTNYQK